MARIISCLFIITLAYINLNTAACNDVRIEKMKCIQEKTKESVDALNSTYLTAIKILNLLKTEQFLVRDIKITTINSLLHSSIMNLDVRLTRNGVLNRFDWNYRASVELIKNDIRVPSSRGLNIINFCINENYYSLSGALEKDYQAVLAEGQSIIHGNIDELVNFSVSSPCASQLSTEECLNKKEIDFGARATIYESRVSSIISQINVHVTRMRSESAKCLDRYLVPVYINENELDDDDDDI